MTFPPSPPVQPNSAAPTPGIDPGFSADGYLYAHKDLLSALPSTAPDVRKKFALDHYGGHGKGEGRTFATLPANFSPEEYLAIHQDVAKAAPDNPKDRFVFAIGHFLHSGTGEGRHYHDLPPGFSAERYLSLHPDVAALAPADPSRRVEFAMWHYLHHGQNEGRTHDGSTSSSSGASSSGGASASPATPPGFDAETYLSLNPDLAAAAPAGAQERQAFAEWHYLNHGVNEGRKYSKIPPVPSFGPRTPPTLPIKPPAPSTPSQPNRQGLFGDINKGGFQLKKVQTNDRSGPNLGKGGK
ncbi:MAG: WH2 domain-containing protein [Alphaproteobacteria bacterium]